MSNISIPKYSSVIFTEQKKHRIESIENNVVLDPDMEWNLAGLRPQGSVTRGGRNDILYLAADAHIRKQD